MNLYAWGSNSFLGLRLLRAGNFLFLLFYHEIYTNATRTISPSSGKFRIILSSAHFHAHFLLFSRIMERVKSGEQIVDKEEVFAANDELEGETEDNEDEKYDEESEGEDTTKPVPGHRVFHAKFVSEKVRNPFFGLAHIFFELVLP